MSKANAPKIIYSLLIATGAFGTLTQFQNCAPEGAFESASLNVPSVEDLGDFEDLEDEHDTSKFSEKPITSFAPPLMDRQATISILENAFGSSWTVESSNIETRAVEFGKGCSVYQEYNAKVNNAVVLGQGAETCRGNSPQFNIGLEVSANPARSSFLLSACSELTNNTTTLTYFMNKVGTAAERASYNNETLIRAYHAFYVGKANPSQAVIDSLKMIGQNQSNSQKAWSAIAFSLCASGHWQVL